MNDFIDNKYRRWYFQICERAQARTDNPSGERHHVVPKSIGGSNAAANLVSLTYREHFLAHWLLTKFTTGDALRKMQRALGCMTFSRTGGRVVHAWQYAIVRKACHEAHRGQKYALGTTRSAETRAKIGQAARNRSPETLAKLSFHSSNRSAETREKLRTAASNPSPEDRAKKSAAAKARKASAETKAKISAAMKGNNRCTGRKLSAETRAKIGAASRRRSPESNAKISAARLAAEALKRASVNATGVNP